MFSLSERRYFGKALRNVQSLVLGILVNNDICLDGRCGIFEVAGGQVPEAVMKLKSALALPV